MRCSSTSSFPLASPFSSPDKHNTTSVSSPIYVPSTSDSPVSPAVPTFTLPIRQSFRVVKPPSYLQDYHCSLATSLPPSNMPSANTSYPIQHTISYSHLSASHKAFTLAISTPTKPQFYHEAVKSSHWVVAMSKELEALEANNTLVLSSLPPSKQPIGCKWVYKLKFKSNWTI